MTIVEDAVNDNDAEINTLINSVIGLNSGVNANAVNITNTVNNTFSNFTNITTNTANIATNSTNIAANTDAIAALSVGNAADISALRSDLSAGIAMSNAMEIFLPDPGARFRLNVGMGYYGGTTAYGVTAAGRLQDNMTAVYFGAAIDGNFSQTSAKAGVSWQW